MKVPMILSPVTYGVTRRESNLLDIRNTTKCGTLKLSPVRRMYHASNVVVDVLLPRELLMDGRPARAASLNYCKRKRQVALSHDFIVDFHMNHHASNCIIDVCALRHLRRSAWVYEIY